MGKKRVLLDLCSGTGRVARWIRKHGFPCREFDWLIDKRLDAAAVEAARAEEPEVWEDAHGEGPSNDAGAALSSFLYAYSGGWRNTFG